MGFNSGFKGLNKESSITTNILLYMLTSR